MQDRGFVEGIVGDLVEHQRSPQPESSKSGGFSFPRLIGVGDGGAIEVSEKIDDLIADFARKKMISDPSLKTRFAIKDFVTLVRNAFGPALARVDLSADLGTNVEAVLCHVEAEIKKNLAWISSKGQREFAFGCTLFSYGDIPPFKIGPVRFEPRLTWLDRKASDGRSARVGADGRISRFGRKIADGPVSTIAKRRIIRAWRGEKLKKRTPSTDAHVEKSIIRAVGNCPYVCSISISGFGSEAGQDKAMISIRLALAAISLMWAGPSDALRGLNLRHDSENSTWSLLSFSADGLISSGGARSSMPHAPWVERDELERILKRYETTFDVAGKAIAHFGGSSEANQPKTMTTLVHALLWFHEACRERTSPIAVVKFGAALDALAKGRGEMEIVKMLHARLGIGGNQKFLRDGTTLKKVVERIYKEGRSRVAHGSSDKLNHDWSDTRDAAEWLTRRSLIACMDWVAKNPTVDDPKQFSI